MAQVGTFDRDIIITNAKIQLNFFITNDKIVHKIIIGNEKSRPM